MIYLFYDVLYTTLYWNNILCWKLYLYDIYTYSMTEIPRLKEHLQCHRWMKCYISVLQLRHRNWSLYCILIQCQEAVNFSPKFQIKCLQVCLFYIIVQFIILIDRELYKVQRNEQQLQSSLIQDIILTTNCDTRFKHSKPVLGLKVI